MSSGLRNLERFCRSKPFSFVSDHAATIRKRNRQHMFLPITSIPEQLSALLLLQQTECFSIDLEEETLAEEEPERNILPAKCSLSRAVLTWGPKLLTSLFIVNEPVVCFEKDEDLNTEMSSSGSIRHCGEHRRIQEVKTHSRAWAREMLTGC